MANTKNGNKTWIAGAILGAVAGAAYALWKTPMSGQELRGKLGTGGVNADETLVSDTTHTQGVGGKILSKVEHTLAPMVGVELGKTAHGFDSNNGEIIQPVAPAAPRPAVQPVPPVEPAVHPEPAAPIATKVVESVKEPEVKAVPNYGEESVKAKRFAWGDPAPDSTPNQPGEAAMPVVAPAPAPAIQPVTAAATPTGATEFGSDSIRSKRFAWGDPAPEADNDGDDTAGISPVDQPTNVIAPVAEESPLDAATSAASEPGANMRKFPKLGGLEN